MPYEPSAPVLHFVEDDPNWTHLFCAEFRKIAPKWEIVCSEDGLAGKHTLATSEVPQAVVTDLNMPGMGGLRLIEWIKNQSQFRQLPVFANSSSADPDDRLRCAALNVTGYLDKPSSMTELRNNIRYIVKLCEDAPFFPQAWKTESSVRDLSVHSHL